MATTPLSLDVKVQVHVDKAAVERLQKAQDRFSTAVQELYAAMSEVQTATLEFGQAVTTSEVVDPEPEPEPAPEATP